ncbi:MAG: hypothetical protein ACK48R_12105, partial [Planctomyces sp.]
QGLFESILEQVGRGVVGQQELVEGVVLALFAEGSADRGASGVGQDAAGERIVKDGVVSVSPRPVYSGPDAIGFDGAQYL